jgi:hypothetical protein
MLQINFVSQLLSLGPTAPTSSTIATPMIEAAIEQELSGKEVSQQAANFFKKYTFSISKMIENFVLQEQLVLQSTVPKFLAIDHFKDVKAVSG